jgi:hypothetical protein
MKPTPVTLPPHCAQRVGPEFAARIVGAGETALLAEPLLGLIASRECLGHVLPAMPLACQAVVPSAILEQARVQSFEVRSRG